MAIQRFLTTFVFALFLSACCGGAPIGAVRQPHPEVEVNFDGAGASVTDPFDLFDGQALIHVDHAWDGQEHFMVKLERMDAGIVLGGLVVNEANTIFRPLEYVRAEGIVRVHPGSHVLQVKANPGSRWQIRVFQPAVR